MGQLFPFWEKVRGQKSNNLHKTLHHAKTKKAQNEGISRQNTNNLTLNANNLEDSIKSITFVETNGIKPKNKMANNIDLSVLTFRERLELQTKENERYLGKFYKGSEREKKDKEIKNK